MKLRIIKKTYSNNDVWYHVQKKFMFWWIPAYTENDMGMFRNLRNAEAYATELSKKLVSEKVIATFD